MKSLALGALASTTVAIILPPLLAQSTGCWSVAHWDPVAHTGWRTLDRAAETWLFIDTSSTHRTVIVPPQLVAGIPAHVSPEELELCGLSPCDLWDGAPRRIPVWGRIPSLEAIATCERITSHVAVVGYGWPWIQHWHLRWIDSQGAPQSAYWLSSGDTDSRRVSADPPQYGISLRVSWLGFGLNTAAWSSAILAVTIGPRALISTHRRRQCRCVHCGYPREGKQVCPECGRCAVPIFDRSGAKRK